MKTFPTSRRSWRRGVLAFFCAGLAALHAGGASLYTENFEGGANGWGDRDIGVDMSVSPQASVGNPPSGAMQGIFASQGFALPQSDAFMINSGANFMGSYAGLAAFTFDLYAEHVRPSDLTFRLVSGSDYYFYSLNTSSMSIDTWTTYSVPLQYSLGWQGGAAGFASAIGNVTRLEVQLTRNGTGLQTFYMDNFAASDQYTGPQTIVPEPSSMSLMAVVGAVLYYRRRHRKVVHTKRPEVR